MAVDYLRDYLGIDPADYSAMEQNIAGVSPVGQSIIPTMGATPTVQPRMIDDTPIAFTPRPMQDFGAQISGLEEQINNLMEQMGVLEAEKNDALQQQDVMRAELAQAQQDALTKQASEFEGVKSSLEQQIADLTAQIGSMQEPTETPATGEEPTATPAVIVFGPDGTMYSSPAAAERAGVTNYTMRPPGALPFTPKPPSIGGVGGRDLEDRQIIERRPPITPPLEDRGFGPGIRRSEDFFIPEDKMMGKVNLRPPRNPPELLTETFVPPPQPPSITERPLEKLPSGPRRQDFMSIDRLGKDTMDILPPMPSPVAPIPPAIPPMTPPMTPRPRPRPVPMPQPMTPSMPMPQPLAPTIRPDMTMMGGARGGFAGTMRPTMMRAGGGGISKAIVDLESKLR
jgi:hypothetical protein